MLPADPEIRPASMERDYIAHWLSERRRIALVPCNGSFIDIGTPESLDGAADFMESCGLFPLAS